MSTETDPILTPDKVSLRCVSPTIDLGMRGSDRPHALPDRDDKASILLDLPVDRDQTASLVHRLADEDAIEGIAVKRRQRSQVGHMVSVDWQNLHTSLCYIPLPPGSWVCDGRAGFVLFDRHLPQGCRTDGGFAALEDAGSLLRKTFRQVVCPD